MALLKTCAILLLALSTVGASDRGVSNSGERWQTGEELPDLDDIIAAFDTDVSSRLACAANMTG